MKSYSQRRSRLQEKRAARDVGGQMQSGSGSSGFAKGDFRSMGNIRGECKFTKSDSYTLKKADLEKIALEALKGGGEGWVMQVEFVGAGGQSKKLAVLDYGVFQDMHIHHDAVFDFALKSAGKTFVIKKDDYRARSSCVVSFKDDSPLRMYAIILWQTYLEVRQAYMETQE